jgi:hypothetical protein
MGRVSGEDRDAIVAKIAAELGGLVTFAQAERIAQGPTGRHADWLDRLLSELEPLAEHAHDLQTFQSIRKLVVVHGGGPWDPDELASMTGRDLDSVRRVLTDLLRAGLVPPVGNGEDGQEDGC